MTDEADHGNEHAAQWLEAMIEQRRYAGIEPGPPGECWHCGYNVPRLVRGLCPRCRDELGED